MEDQSVGFPIQDLQSAGSVRPDRDGTERIGGYGLQLVRQMADHIAFSSSDAHGTKVFAEKTLHYKTHAEAISAQQIDETVGGEMRMASAD